MPYINQSTLIYQPNTSHQSIEQTSITSWRRSGLITVVSLIRHNVMGPRYATRCRYHGCRRHVAGKSRGSKGHASRGYNRRGVLNPVRGGQWLADVGRPVHRRWSRGSWWNRRPVHSLVRRLVYIAHKWTYTRQRSAVDFFTRQFSNHKIRFTHPCFERSCPERATSHDYSVNP